MKRGPVIVALVVGLGLVAAPAIFKMFTRAPLGGQMIEEFKPYMTTSNISKFQGYMDMFQSAHAETLGRGLPAAGTDLNTVGTKYPQVGTFVQQWPGIYSDMSGMLKQMTSDIDNFEAVAALPPFILFPWFFVMPGLMIAAFAWLALRKHSKGQDPKLMTRLVAIMGVGLIAAPAIFQMFTRAPLGGEMIDDFKPLMTTEKVSNMQLYFLTIASGEGQLRTEMKPEIMRRQRLDEAGYASAFPGMAEFSEKFPKVAQEMAPMIAAMSDNLDNYAAVAALPPFPLFPWFFVIPGVMLIVLGLMAGRGSPAPAATTAATSSDAAPGSDTKAYFDDLKEKAQQKAALRKDPSSR